MTFVLIVEDEPEIAQLVEKFVLASGKRCKIIDNGARVVNWVKENEPDIIVLDLMIPEKSGTTVCREIRQFSDVPIIMATAKVDENDRLNGFDCGATDYICKPYSAKELMARIDSLMNLYNRLNKKNSSGIVLDAQALKVSGQGEEIELSSVEFGLFSLLFNHPGRVYSRAQIIEQAYKDFRVVSDRTVDSHIKNLRKKLAKISPEKDLINSVYGAGYKYEI